MMRANQEDDARTWAGRPALARRTGSPGPRRSCGRASGRLPLAPNQEGLACQAPTKNETHARLSAAPSKHSQGTEEEPGQGWWIKLTPGFKTREGSGLLPVKAWAPGPAGTRL